MNLPRNARRLACLLLLAVLLASAAVVLAAPGRQDAYPEPAQATAEPLAPADYPPPFQDSGVAPPTIGSPLTGEPGTDLSGAAAASPTPPSSRGLLYLWLGFAATLLIFAASVLGSIMLFVRRIES